MLYIQLDKNVRVYLIFIANRVLLVASQIVDFLFLGEVRLNKHVKYLSLLVSGHGHLYI